MTNQTFRTLHADAALEDVVTSEQRIQNLVFRMNLLEERCSAAVERIQQLEKLLEEKDAVLSSRISQIEKRGAESETVFRNRRSVSETGTSSAGSLLNPTESRNGSLSSSSHARNCPVLSGFDTDSGVFGNYSLRRDRITSITFLDTLASAPRNGAWDISRQNDGSALAWMGGNDRLFIA